MIHRNTFLIPVFALAVFGSGCELFDFEEFDDGQTVVTETSEHYVTLVVKDRFGFKIKDPLGRRVTGGTCAVWRDEPDAVSGECCWNARAECACPCPER